MGFSPRMSGWVGSGAVPPRCAPPCPKTGVSKDCHSVWLCFLHGFGSTRMKETASSVKHVGCFRCNSADSTRRRCMSTGPLFMWVAPARRRCWPSESGFAELPIDCFLQVCGIFPGLGLFIQYLLMGMWSLCLRRLDPSAWQT